MTLKKGSFICKVAYGLNDKVPGQVSLCKLFRRFMFWFFVVWPVLIALAAFLIVIFSIGAFVFVGKRIDFGAKTDDFVPIPYLHKLPPIIFIVAGWLIYSVVYSIIYQMNPMSPGGYINNYGLTALVGDIITMVVLAIGLFVTGVGLLFEGYGKLKMMRTKRAAIPTKPSRLRESVVFIKAYLKARKKKVCPIITIQE